MKHGVLKHWHPMMGVDFHIPWPPGSPSPLPGPAPYRTATLMIGSGLGVLANTTKPTEKQMTDAFSMTMLAGTDIGPLIPHIGPPSLTLPVEMLFSASKSHFSTSKYKAGGQAVACSLLVVASPNLNCGTPVPSPTGMVLALTTHRVDMTWGDLFAGFGRMFADWCVQTVLNLIGNKIGGALGGFVQRQVFARANYRFAMQALMAGGDAELAVAWAGMMAAVRGERIGNVAGTIAGTVVGFFVGGPMGADVASFGGYNGSRDDAWTPGGAGGTAISDQYDQWCQGLGESFEQSATGKAVDNYLNDGSVSDHPAPGTPATTPL